MTLQEAIEAIEDTYDESWVKYNPSMQNALKLGSEALKRVKGLRVYEVGPVQVMLPGETEE